MEGTDLAKASVRQPLIGRPQVITRRRLPFEGCDPMLSEAALGANSHRRTRTECRPVIIGGRIGHIPLP